MSALRSRLSYANVVSSLALFIALGGGAMAAKSAFPGTDGTITACVTKSNGKVRIVKASKKCKRTEERVKWNQKGVAGTNGAQGVPGAPGAAGKNGVNGVNGTNGANGAQGPTGPTGATGSTGPTGATGPTGSTPIMP